MGGDRDDPQGKTTMPDGMVYAGVSPDTGKAMYTTRTDSPRIVAWDKAADVAAAFNKCIAYGHNDWRVPTKAELNALFNNRAAIGGFNETGYIATDALLCPGLYWLADKEGECQRFSDGVQGWSLPGVLASLRLVCGGEAI